MERYFIVFYTYNAEHNVNNNINSSNITGEGYKTITCNGFVNQKETEESIIKELMKKYSFFTNVNPIIKNIIELNEEDYNDWLG